MNEFKTPRFVLAAFFSCVTTISYLFTDKMSSDQYITVIGVVLTMWGGMKVANRMGGSNGN
jgi:uncharacterized membrane protein YfcA